MPTLLPYPEVLRDWEAGLREGSCYKEGAQTPVGGWRARRMMLGMPSSAPLQRG